MELLAGIEDTAGKMDANLKRRVEWKGTVPVHVVGERKKEEVNLIPVGTAALILVGFVSLLGCPVDAFTAYVCKIRSDIVESHPLLD